jgi:2-hydroxy-6-oxonona-2,4-dienedioate hydrolase
LKIIANKKLTVVFIMIILIGFFLGFPYFVPIDKKQVDPQQLPFYNSILTQIDGVRLHYRVWEPDTLKGNVLLIHGFAGSTFSWRNNAEALSNKGYRVVAVDLPAFGFSDKSKAVNYSSYNQSNIVWKLISGMDSSSWNIIGHSMGADIAGIMAITNPASTGKLIFVGGTAQGQKKSRAVAVLKFDPLQRWAEVIANWRFYNYKKFENLLSSAYGQLPDSLAVKGYLEPFTYEGSTTAIFDMAASAAYHNQEDYDLLTEKPILLIWGENDSWVPLKRAEAFKNNNKNTQLLIIPNSGHCVMETHPEIVNEILLEYLQK